MSSSSNRASIVGRPYFWGRDPYDGMISLVAYVHGSLLIVFHLLGGLYAPSGNGVFLYFGLNAGSTSSSSSSGVLANGKPALSGYSNLENYGGILTVLLTHTLLGMLGGALISMIRRVVHTEGGGVAGDDTAKWMQKKVLALAGAVTSGAVTTLTSGHVVSAESIFHHHTEGGLAFVVSFLSYALFVNRPCAVHLATLYVILLFVYPFLFAFYGRATVLTTFASGPMGMIVYLFVLSTLGKIYLDWDILGVAAGANIFVLSGSIFFVQSLMMVLQTVYLFAIGPLMASGVAFDSDATPERPATKKIVEELRSSRAAGATTAAPSRPLTPEELAARQKEQESRDGYSGKTIGGRRL
ncbi:unnamed protein product [Amoebophrya sp. A25]|nr:unnamed protein product [Amoebophrya sp. A25]|eukprot:GSA25T00014123001.1